MEGQAPPRIKDKSAAPIQITAEQLLQEATARPAEHLFRRKPLSKNIIDVADYRQSQRRVFEDAVRRSRGHVGTWLRYAKWEQAQGDFARARSVYERALDADPRCPTLWIRYVEMELTCKNQALARNLLDRAVTQMPRLDQLWLRYTWLEEAIGDSAAAEVIWRRWMVWEPDEKAMWACLKFAQRHKLTELGELAIAKLLGVHGDDPSIWIRVAQASEDLRNIFERALDAFAPNPPDSLLIAFAKFEASLGELERAKAIYGLSANPSASLLHSWAAFDRQHGTGDTSTLRYEREYLKLLQENPLDYDTWHSLLDLNPSQEYFERALACVPPSTEKQHWRRFVFLWLRYAHQSEDPLEVYKRALREVPVPFTKLYRAAAEHYLRAKDLTSFRVLMGNAIGRYPQKASLFRFYIEIELKLHQWERVRQLHTQWIKKRPESAVAYIAFAETELLLNESERALKIFELGTQNAEDAELVWRVWLETQEELTGDSSGVFELLLERSGHPRVWLAYAQMHKRQGRVEQMRSVLNRALAMCDGENRQLILDTWRLLDPGTKVIEEDTSDLLLEAAKLWKQSGL